jgi:hypothetical protein
MLTSDHASSQRFMTNADVSRLPLKKIEAALRKTTEVLAAELAAPTETAPDWTDFEWRIAQASAAMHGVSPLLATTLRWRGSDSWELFVREQREQTFQRHQRISELLTDIGSRAKHDGIAIVPLKGAALHAIGIYQPGERPMSDIDVLVRISDVQATSRLLGSCGYHEVLATWKHRVFEPKAHATVSDFGEHAQNCIKIELHAGVVERLPLVDRDVTRLVFPDTPVAGLNGYPSHASLMAHLLLHAAGNMCSSHLRLLHLHDISLLARRMSESDWQRIFAPVNGQRPWWVSPPLTLTAHYYPSAIPADIVARAQSNCSWLLRQTCRRQLLSDVSLSSLWIQAFPGIEWSHSTQEALSHVMGRVKPDRQLLLGRKKAVKLLPCSARYSWTHLSQWQRIVRWVFHGYPRVETLACVCTALARLGAPPRIT